jgi:hypothetical protein
MKLFAFNINGNTNQKVGIDELSWSNDVLNDNKPFLISYDDNVSYSDYSDVSTIENWDRFGLPYATDYGSVKFAVKDIVDEKSWSGLTNIEKDLAIKYYSYPSDVEAAIHLMTTKGLGQQEAQGYILRAWHKHHLNFIESCKLRWAYAKYYVLLYLSRVDAEDLFETTKNLIDYYVETGRLGVEYNDDNSGIIDFIYSVNEYSGQGMEESGYILQRGTWTEFREQLKDVFVYGKYTEYN